VQLCWPIEHSNDEVKVQSRRKVDEPGLGNEAETRMQLGIAVRAKAESREFVPIGPNVENAHDSQKTSWEFEEGSGDLRGFVSSELYSPPRDGSAP